MKISIEISAATTKRLIALGVIGAGLVAGSVAWAGLYEFKDGAAEPLTALQLNGNFGELEGQITTLRGQLTTLKAEVALKASAFVTTSRLNDLESTTASLQKGPAWYRATCTSPAANTWDCSCDDGYVAVSGGAYGAGASGNAIRGSTQQSPRVWRVSCANEGAGASCEQAFAICVRASAP